MSLFCHRANLSRENIMKLIIYRVFLLIFITLFSSCGWAISNIKAPAITVFISGTSIYRPIDSPYESTFKCRTLTAGGNVYISNPDMTPSTIPCDGVTSAFKVNNSFLYNTNVINYSSFAVTISVNWSARGNDANVERTFPGSSGPTCSVDVPNRVTFGSITKGSISSRERPLTSNPTGVGTLTYTASGYDTSNNPELSDGNGHSLSYQITGAGITNTAGIITGPVDTAMLKLDPVSSSQAPGSYTGSLTVSITCQ